MGVAVAGWLLASHPRGAAQPGPIVLISIDTLRADHLPAYGYRGVATPAIDALAADGIVFEHAYAHAPQTLPSHTSILSGQLPFEHGVRDNVGFTVKPGQRLLAEMFRDRGFQTAGFASAFVLRKESGIAQGFQVYDAEMPPTSPNVSIGMVRRDGAQTLDLAEQWLDKQTSARFFLFVHFYEPHRPYRPPARYAHYPNLYDGTIAYSDELVGRLVADLKRRGFYDGAVIALLSDHGEGLGDHGEQEHGVFLYDETIHVPFIVKRAGERDAGKRVSAPIEHIDLVPTLLDLAGLPVPRDLHGESLRAAMDGSDSSLAQRGIYSETLYPLYHFGWSPLYALTDPRYRFILAPRTELYDLERDPGERHNLRADRTQTATSMQAALDDLVRRHGIDRPSVVSRGELEQFQALGYIGTARVPRAAETGALPDPKDKVGALEGYRRAVDLTGEGKLDEAVSAFRAVLKDNPTMADVWTELSAVLLRQERTAEAVDALQRAVNLDPTVVENQLTLAGEQISLGQLEEATRHARAALASQPGAAHEMLARVAMARGDQAGAVREARLAEQADASLPLPLYIEGLALQRDGKYDQALAFFERARAALKPHNRELTDLHLNTADTLVRLGRYDEAEAQFKEEIAKFPENARARTGLAMLYRAQGRVREANDVLDAMLRTSPTARNYAMAARTLQIIGEADEARQVVARGLQQFPNSPELHAVGTAGSKQQ